MVVVEVEVETIQHPCWCFEIERGMTIQSRSVADDRVAGEASEVVLERSCFFVVCCHREGPLGAGRCTWRTAFAFCSLCLSDHGVDIQNTDVATSKTDDDRLQTEIKTFYNPS